VSLLLSPSPWLTGFAVLLGCAAACGLVYFFRIVPVGLAYKAKILASAVFVSGRKFEDILAEDVSVDDYAIMRLFRARLDRDSATVSVTFLGARTRTAAYRPGLGATLALGKTPETLTPRSLSLSSASGVWPVRIDKAFEPVLDGAFREENAKRLKRTRAVLIVKDGTIVGERYAPGFSAEMPLCGWSMSKSVLSALIGIQIGEGKLSRDQKSLLPEWRGPGDERGEITLDHLLRMRSGLEFAEIYSNPLEDVTQMIFARGDAAGFAAAKPLKAQPGTVWSYSSGTSNILARILRQTLGGSDEDYLSFPRTALYDRIGMSSAVFEANAAGDLVASSFMYATARDWARFGQLYLQDGLWEGERILPEGWVAYSVQPTPESTDNIYGAHWWLKVQKVMGGDTEDAKKIPEDAFYAIGHEGQVLSVVPSKKLVVVRLGLSVYIDAWNHAEFMAALLEKV